MPISFESMICFLRVALLLDTTWFFGLKEYECVYVIVSFYFDNLLNALYSKCFLFKDEEIQFDYLITTLFFSYCYLSIGLSTTGMFMLCYVLSPLSWV